MKKEDAYILEGNIPKEIWDVLLRDHTTQRNIFWATKDYEQWGDGYTEYYEINYVIYLVGISSSNINIVHN